MTVTGEVSVRARILWVIAFVALVAGVIAVMSAPARTSGTMYV